MEAHVSTLENSEYTLVDNRKSKGKVDFITKVSRFNLIVKYKLFGIEKFSDTQLDMFIDFLNENKINYKQDRIEKEAKLLAEREKYEKKVEEIASLDPEKFSEDGLTKLDNEFEKVESNINSEIAEIKELAKENRKILKEAKEEKDSRIKPVNMGPYELEFPKTDVPQEPDEDEDLEEKIIESTEHSIENSGVPNTPINIGGETFDDALIKKIDDEISEMENKKASTNQDIAPSDTVDIAMNEFNEKTISLKNEVKNSSVKVVESNIERLTTELVVGMNDLVQKVLNDASQTAENKFNEFRNQISIENEKNANLTNELNNTKEELNNANNTISERDKEIAELKEALAKKEAELTEKENTINDMTNRSKGFTDEIDRLTSENVNFRTTINTLLSSASNAMIAPVDVEEGAKTK